MANKIVDIKIDEKEPQIIQPVTKAKYQAIIEAYKKKNPVKYELKKAELEAKLAAIK